MQEAVHATPSSSGLVSNMPENISCIVSILLHIVVVLQYLRNPCGNYVQVSATWELAWVEVVVDDYRDVSTPCNDLERVD